MGVGGGEAVGDGDVDGEAIGRALGGGATEGLTIGDGPAATMTGAGDPEPSWTLKPPRTARNPNDAASAAARTRAAPITAGEVGSRRGDGNGASARRRPRR